MNIDKGFLLLRSEAVMKQLTEIKNYAQTMRISLREIVENTFDPKILNYLSLDKNEQKLHLRDPENVRAIKNLWNTLYQLEEAIEKLENILLPYCDEEGNFDKTKLININNIPNYHEFFEAYRNTRSLLKEIRNMGETLSFLQGSTSEVIAANQVKLDRVNRAFEDISSQFQLEKKSELNEVKEEMGEDVEGFLSVTTKRDSTLELLDNFINSLIKEIQNSSDKTKIQFILDKKGYYRILEEDSEQIRNYKNLLNALITLRRLYMVFKEIGQNGFVGYVKDGRKIYSLSTLLTEQIKAVKEINSPHLNKMLQETDALFCEMIISIDTIEENIGLKRGALLKDSIANAFRVIHELLANGANVLSYKETTGSYIDVYARKRERARIERLEKKNQNYNSLLDIKEGHSYLDRLYEIKEIFSSLNLKNKSYRLNDLSTDNLKKIKEILDDLDLDSKFVNNMKKEIDLILSGSSRFSWNLFKSDNANLEKISEKLMDRIQKLETEVSTARELKLRIETRDYSQKQTVVIEPKQIEPILPNFSEKEQESKKPTLLERLTNIKRKVSPEYKDPNEASPYNRVINMNLEEDDEISEMFSTLAEESSLSKEVDSNEIMDIVSEKSKIEALREYTQSTRDFLKSSVDTYFIKDITVYFDFSAEEQKIHPYDPSNVKLIKNVLNTTYRLEKTLDELEKLIDLYFDKEGNLKKWELINVNNISQILKLARKVKRTLNELKSFQENLSSINFVESVSIGDYGYQLNKLNDSYKKVERKLSLIPSSKHQENDEIESDNVNEKEERFTIKTRLDANLAMIDDQLNKISEKILKSNSYDKKRFKTNAKGFYEISSDDKDIVKNYKLMANSLLRLRRTYLLIQKSSQKGIVGILKNSRKIYKNISELVKDVSVLAALNHKEFKEFSVALDDLLGKAVIDIDALEEFAGLKRNTIFNTPVAQLFFSLHQTLIGKGSAFFTEKTNAFHEVYAERRERARKERLLNVEENYSRILDKKADRSKVERLDEVIFTLAREIRSGKKGHLNQFDDDFLEKISEIFENSDLSDVEQQNLLVSNQQEKILELARRQSLDLQVKLNNCRLYKNSIKQRDYSASEEIVYIESQPEPKLPEFSIERLSAEFQTMNVESSGSLLNANRLEIESSATLLKTNELQYEEEYLLQEQEKLTNAARPSFGRKFLEKLESYYDRMSKYLVKIMLHDFSKKEKITEKSVEIDRELSSDDFVFHFIEKTKGDENKKEVTEISDELKKAKETVKPEGAGDLKVR